jgi:hypothetical protein
MDDGFLLSWFAGGREQEMGWVCLSISVSCSAKARAREGVFVLGSTMQAMLYLYVFVDRFVGKKCI